MDSRSLLKYKTVLVLLSVVVVNLVALVFVWRLDGFVHGDLYAFGLVFSYDWANEYWHSNLMVWLLVGVATAVAAMSTIPHIMHSRAPSRFSQWTGFTLPALALVYQALGITYLNQINNIVWNKLYEYGVQYNIDWATTYNPISMPALTLMAIGLLALIIPAIRALDIIEIEIVMETE